MNFITLFNDQQGEIKFEFGRTKKKESTWYDESTTLRNFWEEKTKLRICTDIEQPPHKIPKPVEEFNVPLLKSSLQKSVRRRKTKAALNLAWQLISQDLTEFLRRFAVIILEDCVLHPKYSNLIWMMVAESKGWKLRKEQIELLLQMVYQVANCEYRDHLHYSEEEFVNPVNQNDNPLLASIIVRINFGGMKGDQEFMKNLVMMWNRRLKDENTWKDHFHNIFPEITTEIKKEIEEMVSTKCLLQDSSKLQEGVDFHVFPKMLNSFCDMLREKGELNIPQTFELQTMIWNHVSGISVKKFITTEEDLFQIELQKECKCNVSQTVEKWKAIKEDWSLFTSNEKYWQPIPDEKVAPKVKKNKNNNHKITDFFKLE